MLITNILLEPQNLNLIHTNRSPRIGKVGYNMNEYTALGIPNFIDVKQWLTNEEVDEGNSNPAFGSVGRPVIFE